MNRSKWIGMFTVKNAAVGVGVITALGVIGLVSAHAVARASDHAVARVSDHAVARASDHAVARGSDAGHLRLNLRRQRIVTVGRLELGTNKLLNGSKRPIIVVEPHRRVSTEQIGNALQMFNRTGDASRLVGAGGVVDVVRPHGAAYVNIRKHTYYFAIADRRSYTNGQITKIRPSGRSDLIVSPSAATLWIAPSGKLRLQGRLGHARSRLNLRDEAPGTREVVLLELGKRATDRQLNQFAKAPSFPHLASLVDMRTAQLVAVTSQDRLRSLTLMAGRRELLVSWALPSHPGLPSLHAGDALILHA